MFYTYTTLSGLHGYLKPAYRQGAFSTRDPGKIMGILDSKLHKAILRRTLTVYFFKESLRKNAHVYTYALRYDLAPDAKTSSACSRTKIIRGFVDVTPVSFLTYVRAKVKHFWRYWVVDSTPSNKYEIFL